jgi:hypothetical protein
LVRALDALVEGLADLAAYRGYLGFLTSQSKSSRPDLDQTMLTRGRSGCFTADSLALPEPWRTAALLRQGVPHCVRDH